MPGLFPAQARLLHALRPYASLEVAHVLLPSILAAVAVGNVLLLFNSERLNQVITRHDDFVEVATRARGGPTFHEAEAAELEGSERQATADLATRTTRMQAEE